MRFWRKVYAASSGEAGGEWGGDFNAAVGFIGRRDGDVDAAFGEQGEDSAGPLHHHDAALLEQLLKPDRFKIVGAVNAVSVEVVDGKTAAFVDVEEDEGWTRHGPRIGAQGPS